MGRAFNCINRRRDNYLDMAIQIRRGTAAAIAAANPTLAAGEPVFETDTGTMKIGDGSTAWNSLGYTNIRRLDGTFEGTGADQSVSHGFQATPKKLELIPLEAGITFTGLTVDTTHFHITATTGKDCAFIAEKW
jgi:hypothetical protein